jgi:hypothetical protein
VARQPVDDAMAQGRPAKNTVRQWWLDRVRLRRGSARDRKEVLYLTLPGKEGLDVELLIDSGLIELAEAGPIKVTNPPQIVAFERNLEAYGALRRKFPGLTVRQGDLTDSVGGTAPDVHSKADLRKFARAAVVNLDFTQPWRCTDEGLNPLLTTVGKFAARHEGRKVGGAYEAAMDWSLCLTLNACLMGSPQEHLVELDFLSDQTSGLIELESIMEGLEVGLDDLRGGSSVLAEASSRPAQQILSLLVPLRLINMLISHGWYVRCLKSAAYGGEGETAAMVTFVFDIEAHPLVLSQPGKVSLDCRRLIAESLVRIAEDGTVTGLFD